MNKESDYPIYENPPVAETVFSVQFEGLPAQSVLLAQYWPRVKNAFPKIGVAQPLPTVFEPEFLTPNFQPLTISFEQDNRVVLDGGSYLLQVQSNRFLLNWRKNSTTQDYPGFEINFPKFKNELERFRSFVAEEEIGDIAKFNQLELTYVNIFDVPRDNGSASFSGIFKDHCPRLMENRYLDEPEIMNWNSSYKMSNGAGRLHISSNAGFVIANDGARLQMRVELTARGNSKDDGVSAFDEWFGIAHSHVVKGFADVIDHEFQKSEWGLKQ